MASRITRTPLSLFDDDLSDQSTSRTRPRIEIEPLPLPLQFNIPLPQPPPPPPIDTRVSVFFCLPQPPPPQLPPSQPQLQLQLQPLVAPPPPPPQPQIQPVVTPPQPQPQQPQRRNRRNPTHAPRGGRPAVIEPPYPWATDRRAKVYSLATLMEKGITTVSGDVQCKRCEQCYQIEYNLVEKFSEIAEYVAANKYRLLDRAPVHWTNPMLPKCNYCHQENSVKPKIAEKKKSINWLFLLLGQMLGCCTLDQLKYFCKHTRNHRTGAKDRVLFLTYLALCRQLNPEGPFNLR